MRARTLILNAKEAIEMGEQIVKRQRQKSESKWFDRIEAWNWKERNTRAGIINFGGPDDLYWSREGGWARIDRERRPKDDVSRARDDSPPSGREEIQCEEDGKEEKKKSVFAADAAVDAHFWSLFRFHFRFTFDLDKGERCKLNESEMGSTSEIKRTIELLYSSKQPTLFYIIMFI